MFPYVKEKDQPGTSVTLDEAVERFKGAVELPGPMVSAATVCHGDTTV